MLFSCGLDGGEVLVLFEDYAEDYVWGVVAVLCFYVVVVHDFLAVVFLGFFVFFHG